MNNTCKIEPMNLRVWTFFCISMIVCLGLLPVRAQVLVDKGIFIPKEVQQAYDKGTRLPNGVPGPNYWQNEASYEIEVRVDPAGQMIHGTEEVRYTNNSPDVLNQLVVHLLYDIYRKGNPRDSRIPSDQVTEGVALDYVLLNGDTVQLDNRQMARRSGTTLTLRLPDPLAPGESLTFSAKWAEAIPAQGIRIGAYDSTSYFIGYWYPRIAVYDDIYGWDTRSYTGQEEFYSDLADFDVSITVPDSFLVFATGTLQNAEEVFLEGPYAKYREAQESDETINIITPEEAEQGVVMRSGTWRYRAEQVPDFAFFTSDHYIWEASSQEVAPDRRVFIHTLFPPENAAAHDGVTQVQRTAMAYFSTKVSGVPYPYPSYASINAGGGGGMEFPMMANNGAPSDPTSMANLVAHEMHHMYMPFYVRIDEKRYGWLDEGWADYVTAQFLTSEIGGENFKDQHLSSLTLSLQDFFGTLANVPLMTSSAYLEGNNYGISTYRYSEYTFRLLHNILGEETFNRCLAEFIRRWAYKAPTPYDFFFTFEDVSGQDLAWFWNPWYFEFGYPDLEIAEVRKNRVTIRNSGHRPTVANLEVIYENGTSEKLERGAAVWKEGEQQLRVKIPDLGPVWAILLNKQSPDAYPQNNAYLSEAARKQAGDLSRVKGTYAVNPFVTIEIEPTGDGLLYMKLGAFRMDAYLYPAADGGFSSLTGNINITFDENEAGEVTGMSAALFGNQVPARKVE